MIDSMVFYKSFYDAIKGLEPDLQNEVYNAIFEYGLYGEEIELSPIAKTIFTLIKPQIDANNKRRENGKKGAQYGKLGGRPKKETPKKPQKNPNSTPLEPHDNPMTTPNVNDNVNDNVNELSNNINIITLSQSLKDEIMTEWNSIPEIPHIQSIDGKRADMTRARIAKYGEDDFIKAIRKIENSNFAKGQNNRNWVITYDWFIRPNNFPKVLEGNYSNRASQKPIQQNDRIDWDNI